MALSPPVRSVKGIGNSYFTLSLGLSPLLPAALRRSWPRLSAGRPVLVAFGTLVAGGLLLGSDHTLFNGNYLLQQGATGAAVLTGRPVLFPSVVWWALQLVALAAGAMLAAVAATLGRPSLSASGLSHPRLLLALFSMTSGVFLFLFQSLTRGTVFDRYLWPLDLSVAVLLLARRPAPIARVHARGIGAHARGSTAHAGVAGAHAFPPRPAPTAGALLATTAFSTVVAVVATVITLNADAYDAARWSAGNKAVAAGVPATMVDAGFEWVGSHESAAAVPGRRVLGVPFYETWYDQMFPAFVECAFVSGNEVSLPSLRRLATVSYQGFGFAGRQYLYVYLVRRPGC